MRSPTPYNQSVFINCPFDAAYRPLFDAIVFAVRDCGLVARSAQEVVDAGEVRIDKIRRLIRDSRFGVHDISRTELTTNLPRFNMPLELGLFMGAKAFGNRRQQQKVMLVFERRPYLYRRYCSDIAGQDVVPHYGNSALAIVAVRDWLCSHHANKPMSSGTVIATRFKKFRRELPLICRELRLDSLALTFTDYTAVLVHWLKAQQQVLVRLPG